MKHMRDPIFNNSKLFGFELFFFPSQFPSNQTKKIALIMTRITNIKTVIQITWESYGFFFEIITTVFTLKTVAKPVKCRILPPLFPSYFLRKLYFRVFKSNYAMRFSNRCRSFKFSALIFVEYCGQNYFVKSQSSVLQTPIKESASEFPEVVYQPKNLFS